MDSVYLLQKGNNMADIATVELTVESDGIVVVYGATFTYIEGELVNVERYKTETIILGYSP
jgi:hypothetical protein